MQHAYRGDGTIQAPETWDGPRPDLCEVEGRPATWRGVTHLGAATVCHGDYVVRCEFKSSPARHHHREPLRRPPLIEKSLDAVLAPPGRRVQGHDDPALPVQSDHHLVMGEGAPAVRLHQPDEHRPSGAELALEVGHLPADE